MWTKTSAPLNTLTAKCIKQACADQQTDLTHRLPIHMRQSILDNLVRERIAVGAKFVCELLRDGVYSFDLWALADNNLYKPHEVATILDTLKANSSALTDLVLGGSTWIYNQSVLNGPLRSLFEQGLPKLRSLRIQQTSSADEFVAICQACPNLNKLDICQPSLSDRDIARVEAALAECEPIRKNLRELRLPSTVKNGGITRLLALFSGVSWLKLARFETILEAIEDASIYEGSDYYTQIKATEQLLGKLRGLTITHPLGYDSVEQVVLRCPILEELSLEVQDGMALSSISKLTHLKRLELRNSATTPTSYLAEVAPLLEAIGASLDTLSLEHFDVVDLASCARLCPNLTALSTQWFKILGCNRTITLGMSSGAREAMRTPFKSLRYLRLRPHTQRFVEPEAVDFLLSQAHQLEHCEIYSCLELTDDNLDKIMKTNGLQQLKRLILYHGHSVTGHTLNRLTRHSTNLQYLNCGRPLLSKSELVVDENDNEVVNLLNVP